MCGRIYATIVGAQGAQNACLLNLVLPVKAQDRLLIGSEGASFSRLFISLAVLVAGVGSIFRIPALSAKGKACGLNVMYRW
jgi:hypothetical protein